MLVLVTGTARADTILLVNGGRIEGELLNADESPRKSYILKTWEGAKLTLTAEEVESVTVSTAAQRAYEAAVVKMPDTEVAHWEMAQKCELAALKAERESHLEQVLRHNPDHEGARYALGYSRVGGKWQRQEDFLAGQGYVRYRGAWRLPEEIEMEPRQQADEQQTVEWRKKIRLWREWIIKGRDRAVEGEANLMGIRDPRATGALVSMLKEAKEPRPLKLAYIEVLGRFDNGAAIGALVTASLNDADPTVRDKALEELARSGSHLALEVFIKTLKHADNPMVHRAGVALERMQNPEATLPLIDALITEHKEVVGGGGIQPTFSNGGGGGLSVGGKPQVIKRKLQNQPVLHALNTLYPGVNHGFDQEAWRRWFISRNTPQNVNLRRDE